MATRGKQKRKKDKRYGQRKKPRQALSLENLPPILIASGGSMAEAARHFGITRQAVEDYVARYPDILRPVLKQAKESLVDRAQSGVSHHVDKKDLRACFFVLETLGKKRGFIRQMELAGADPTTGALPIQIIMESNGREIQPPLTPVSHDASLRSEETETNKPEESADRTDDTGEPIPAG